MDGIEYVLVGSSAVVSPDGRFIALSGVRRARGSTELWLADTLNSTMRKLAQWERVGNEMAFTPDSRHLFHVRGHQTIIGSGRMTLESWGSIWVSSTTSATAPVYVAAGHSPAPLGRPRNPWRDR
jgi:Tol biopolymer transport system component